MADITNSPLFWGAFGLVLLVIGLLFVIKPRKAGAAWWKLTQALNPFPVPKWPFGVTLAAGCLFLVLSALMFYGMWSTF